MTDHNIHKTLTVSFAILVRHYLSTLKHI